MSRTRPPGRTVRGLDRAGARARARPHVLGLQPARAARAGAAARPPDGHVGCGEGASLASSPPRAHGRRGRGVRGARRGGPRRRAGVRGPRWRRRRLPLDAAAADLAIASMSLLNIDTMPGGRGGRARARARRPLLLLARAPPETRPSRSGPSGRRLVLRAVRLRGEARARRPRHDVPRHPSPALRLHGRARGRRPADRGAARAGPGKAYLAEHPEMEKWTRRPCFLHVRAVRPE